MKKKTGLILLCILMLSGCAQPSAGAGVPEATVSSPVSEAGELSDAGNEDTFAGLKQTGRMDLRYAKEYEVSYYGDGLSLVDIHETGRYLIAEEGAAVPEGVPEDVAIIKKPLRHTYVAATSVMDLYRQLGVLSNIQMTSTKYEDWSIPEVREALENEDMFYVGKYGTPDFEFVLDCGCDLAIESTMIYHKPETKEKLEELGIPVMVEHSSYEADPLGRLEWIKLYGLLNDRLPEAESFFDGEEEKLTQIKNPSGEKKKTAFFALTPQGAVSVRKQDDYFVKMIEKANGEYVPKGDVSTIQMESFVAGASDADVLIYNSTVYDGPKDLEALLAMNEALRDFKGVREGNVWCTDDDVFQRTTAICDIIREFNAVISGDAGDDTEYFFRLK
ncbi:MAG: ABC transporter substrate-binding protein [Lachnospiraceae bacterium]|nr:ABC transporter substrate-binding protein [Lachnospiraceae bacterium]